MTVKREWYVVDAADKTLGRLATGITITRGKHKPVHTSCGYWRYMDCEWR
jgi:large subunit ribosomal protein L13